MSQPVLRTGEANASAQCQPDGQVWQARLDLVFQPRSNGCRLIRSDHQGPLYVQKPFYPEGRELAHVYLLHPPGGLVSGDTLRLGVRLEEQARVLMTTPGAGRVYHARSDRRLQRQINIIDVARDASMEWLPQENIVYPGAFGSMDTRVNLASGSCFIGWEVTCLGLPANEKRFDHGELRQRLMVCQDGRPLLIENFLLDHASRAILDSPAGLRGLPVNGIFVAGPIASANASDDVIQHLRGTFECLALNGLCGISVVNGFVVGRYLGQAVAEARAFFIRLWETLRPILVEREACCPRIWAT